MMRRNFHSQADGTVFALRTSTPINGRRARSPLIALNIASNLQPELLCPRYWLIIGEDSGGVLFPQAMQ